MVIDNIKRALARPRDDRWIAVPLSLFFAAILIAVIVVLGGLHDSVYYRTSLAAAALMALMLVASAVLLLRKSPLGWLLIGLCGLVMPTILIVLNRGADHHLWSNPFIILPVLCSIDCIGRYIRERRKQA